MKIFISGGVKCGKSYLAQRLAALQKKDKLYYIATMSPVDGEDQKRIARHIADRKGWGFETVEQHRKIEEILDSCDVRGSFLLDSLTALMANEMFYGGHVYLDAQKKITNGLKLIFESVDNIVVVSDFIYSDGYIYDFYTEKYRQMLACADRFCAGNSDIVIEMLYGSKVIYKGRDKLEELERLP